tara:strand:+ start:3335 stop:4186 length:852 start_codon:yes stop_codon:yes gene_type:complete
MVYDEFKNKKSFEDNGFFISENIYTHEDMEDVFFTFYDICLSFINKNKIKNSFPDTQDVSYPDDMKVLDNLVISILNHDKEILGEVYDAFSYSLAFFRFLSNKKIESITKELLSQVSKSALYGWTNRMRIDPPGDERRTYGWHQEIFYTLPESRFIQTWCPILRDTSASNGTILVKKGSHKEGIPHQTWSDIPGKATQILIDDDITKKYETLQIEMRIGEVLFFDGHLAHKSGYNSTSDEVRFSLVGMWHNIGTKGFRAPKPNFELRSISPKEYFSRHMNSRS